MKTDPAYITTLRMFHPQGPPWALATFKPVYSVAILHDKAATIDWVSHWDGKQTIYFALQKLNWKDPMIWANFDPEGTLGGIKCFCHLVGTIHMKTGERGEIIEYHPERQYNLRDFVGGSK